MMNQKPIVTAWADGSCWWSVTFEHFKVLVYVPATDLPDDLLNFGYEAPYLLVLEDELPEPEAAKAYAEKSGLAAVASGAASSVVFVAPTEAGGWKTADEELYKELIANTKIHEYHEHGMAILNNRFTHSIDGYVIRGAIYRAMLFCKGDAADYAAGCLLKPVTGAGLWGPADIVPTACVLEGLSVIPDIGRRDMPLVSVGNTKEINDAVAAGTDHCLIRETAELGEIYESFLKKYMRWGWVGTLQENPDFAAMGMSREFCRTRVTTSPDNMGDDKGTETHEIGYIVYRNECLKNAENVPMVLCFHGGGDSAMHIAQVSSWYKVALDHNFILVCVEDHLNSTATEMKELIARLTEKYPVDRSRIYASGFSMGGCKSWDLYQEYPELFAGLAPMSATFDVGLNLYGQPAPKAINRSIPVPVFYVGGEQSPLPELPFQAAKCRDRMEYILQVNRATAAYDVSFEQRETWENKIQGINGDETEKIRDEAREAVLTLEKFRSEDGEIYTVFGSVDNQGHECRYHSCEQAWLFLSRFRRNEEGKIVRI